MYVSVIYKVRQFLPRVAVLNNEIYSIGIPFFDLNLHSQKSHLFSCFLFYRGHFIQCDFNVFALVHGAYRFCLR